jgi:hypothetical protein
MTDPVEPLLTSSYVIGWKGWHSLHHKKYLASSHGAIWIPNRPLTSTCRTIPMPPDSDCSCGIYAYDDAHADRAWDGIVIGKLAMWGVVQQHDMGFRSEFAYPLELWVPLKEKAVKLADYGVPTHDGRPPHDKLKHESDTQRFVRQIVHNTTTRRAQLDRAKERRIEQKVMMERAIELGLVDNRGNIIICPTCKVARLQCTCPRPQPEVKP